MKCYYKPCPKPCYCESCTLQVNPIDSCDQLPCVAQPTCVTSPCQPTRLSYCPESDSGLLHSLRNGFQRIFSNGRKGGCNSPCGPEPLKGRIYNYTTSQLKNIDMCLDKLEDEISCIQCSVKEAYDCDCYINCNEYRCSLTSIMERLDSIRRDLLCASDCYDSCRDRCEHDMISMMLNRVCSLESCVNELCCQIEYMMCKSNGCNPCDVSCRAPCNKKNKACCYKNGPSCKMPCDPCYVPKCTKPCCYKVNCLPGCQKPCCVKRTVCEVGCRKPCCAKLATCDVNCRKPCCAKTYRCNDYRKLFAKTKCKQKADVCRTSSVIPVGVMLVKL